MRSINTIENYKLSIDMVERYKDKINWDILSQNKTIDWNGLSDEILKSYCNFKILSNNLGINFDIDKIERLKKYIDWYC